MLLTPFKLTPPTSVFVGVELLVQQRGLFNSRTAECAKRFVPESHPG
jgi:hypothetical protein